MIRPSYSYKVGGFKQGEVNMIVVLVQILLSQEVLVQQE